MSGPSPLGAPPVGSPFPGHGRVRAFVESVDHVVARGLDGLAATVVLFGTGLRTGPRLPHDGPPAAVDDLLTEDLATLALDLAERVGAPEVLHAVVEATTGLVPGADAVALAVLRGGTAELTGATVEAAVRLQASELAWHQGPAWQVVGTGAGAVTSSPDLVHDPRWADVGRGGLEAGLRSALSVCVALPAAHRTAVLSCYGPVAALDDDEARRVAVLVAAHASVALDRSLTEANLRAALVSHAEVGRAVGVLVERHKLDPDAAFARLVETSQHTNRRLREVARRLVDQARSSTPSDRDGAAGR